jgi:hypothetical protein
MLCRCNKVLQTSVESLSSQMEPGLQSPHVHHGCRKSFAMAWWWWGTNQAVWVLQPHLRIVSAAQSVALQSRAHTRPDK